MTINPIEVQKHLKGMSYPASKDDVVSTARENGAGDDLIQQLESMGSDQFEAPNEVMKELGGS